MKHEHTPSPQPAAYDTEGRPLYYHPPEVADPVPATSLVTAKPEAYDGHNFDPRLRAQYANEPKFVHAKRELEPTVPEVSEALKRKHEESKRLYPFLNLSEGEFVMMRIRRHPIGWMIPALVTGFVIIVLTVLFFLLPDMYANAVPGSALLDISQGAMAGILLILMLIAVLVGSVALWVYWKNQFFLTNESVIQEIQHSLFSRHEQTVSLGSIEDASFKQNGIIAHIFGYGLMRLSTEGEETTYRFNFVENPKEQVATVNNAVEAFKNGRPVGVEFLDS